MPVLASPGSEQRARVTLYVVDRNDWDTAAEVPIYGMPQSLPGKIVTSPDPASWWDDFLDALRPHLPATVLADTARVYGDPADLALAPQGDLP